ncbi:MAG: cytochrome b [Sphingobacteriia bacterium]|nr:cytochrome b [Sphingobacteriia bacterium]
MEKYSLNMRIMHWVVGVALIALLTIGVIMVELPKEDPFKFQLFGIHKAIGFFVMLLVIARVIIRLKSNIPPAPNVFKRYEIWLSNLTHKTLYLLMLIVPISGYLMSYFGGHPIKIFDFAIPSFLPINHEFGTFFWKTHGIAANILIYLIIIHVLAVFKHYFFDKINILKRIW